VPARVRARIEAELGGRVAHAATQSTGFSPGLAALVETRNGRRAFVKAVGPELNPQSPGIHRREIEIVSQLPPDPAVPRFLWSFDEGPQGWVALGFEAIDGRPPSMPWQDAELRRVSDALVALADRLTPCPIALPPGRELSEAFTTGISGWGKFAAAGQQEAVQGPGPGQVHAPDRGLDDWCRRNLESLVRLEAAAPEAVDGDSLVHLDTRADNLVLTDDHVYVVDWPWACRGAAWVDCVGFAPSVEMQGGPSAEQLVRRFPRVRAADPDRVTATVAAIAGYFTWQAAQPPPPGLPTVRAFQAAQGAVARRWLAERTGLR
jgi:aminoglycoside phosphotransferase (APT) family kinase protein